MVGICAERGITADIERIPIPEIIEAHVRPLRRDVRYRFVIDMATPEWTAAEGSSPGEGRARHSTPG